MTVLVDKLEKELARNCRLNNWDLGFQAAIDIVKQHSSWVSVKEPPSEDGRYLVWYERPWAGGSRTISKSTTDDFINGEWKILGEFITHWHPIQPPSEVQDD